MPIEFECLNCLTTLRVPESAAGKKARCPKCQAILAVPGQASSSPLDPDTSPYLPTPGSLGETKTYPQVNEYAKPQSDFQDVKYGNSNPTESANPYAANLGVGIGSAHIDESFKSRLMAAGIVQLVINLLFLFWLCFSVMTLFVEMLEQGIRDDTIGPLVLASVMCGMQFVGAAGSVSMISKRRRGLALTGTILSMISGVCCCFIPTLIGVFPLVVLMEEPARRLMR